jgi:hypothetical protein
LLGAPQSGALAPHGVILYSVGWVCQKKA